ncbi:hypothetical protein FSP39_003716 [Pinctada imbricata]|uniref:F-box domain-containing protein n=1 Tax=Pinctada imbricata TaxID=66713 RepID=A0AA89C2G5_PINIB|nr:hypothetical protein FSP39_003716 [Pinctada imbricata]
MEGPKRLPGKRQRAKNARANRVKTAPPERKCVTDSEDNIDRLDYPRYCRTVFPLFTNYSDDEVIVSKQKQNERTGIKSSASAPTGRIFKQVQESEKTSSQPVGTSSQTVGTYCTIEELPLECKIKIFSFLTNREKGKCLKVCREWQDIIICPSLWTSIKLWDLSLHCMIEADHPYSDTCFACYKSRVHQFYEFLVELQPRIRKLEFKFDIGKAEDCFKDLLDDVMVNLDMSELKHLEFNWKETPARPFWLESSWYTSSYASVISYQRLRGRMFTYAFDDLTAVISKIKTLVLPFDWNERSVKCLTRLKSLHTLVIEKYLVFQSIPQELLDQVLQGLPNLRRLMLEIWSPSGEGMILYHLSSQSLQYLDISQCRGFYLQSVNLPRLERLQIARPAWNGPLIFRGQLHFPCLYDILVQGSPSLRKINEHYLESNWRRMCYPTLDEALKSICSCKRHKTGWAM